MLPQVNELGPELLADARARLVSGLKRYFHAKHLEGLLSSQVYLPCFSSVLQGVFHGTS